MVVDYHVHLEPDRHFGRCKYTLENLDEYIRQARLAGVDEIGVTEHCNRFRQFMPVMESVMGKEESVPATDQWIRDTCTEDLDDYVQFLHEAKESGYPIKVSIEVDFIPKEAGRIGEILADYEFDYVLGSVHFVGSWAVDYSREVGWPEKPVDEVFEQDDNLVLQAVESGLFDCIAHPDLVKKFGHVPSRDMRPCYERLALAMKKSDVAYEVSTAGLFRPVGEIYPSPAFIEAMHGFGVPFVLSSDAHRPEEVGREFERSLALVREAGYREIAVFEGRKLTAMPL